MRENLILEEDEERGSMIVDEDLIRERIKGIIEKCERNLVVIDGHYAVSVVPKELTTHVFVLRRDPIELRRFMTTHCSFSGRKLWENLASEVLDVCLTDALNVYGNEKICELNITGKSVEEAADDVLAVLKDSKKCHVGTVDWLGKLEKEGLLDEYLRI